MWYAVYMTAGRVAKAEAQAPVVGTDSPAVQGPNTDKEHTMQNEAKWAQDDLVSALRDLELSLERDVARIAQLREAIQDESAQDLAGSCIGSNVTEAVFSVFNTSSHISTAKYAVSTAARLAALPKGQ